MKPRSIYLTVTQLFNLEHVCSCLPLAFGHCTYLVGSVLERPTWRDVDLRCILDDNEYDTFIGNNKARLRLLNTSISEWISSRTELPVDFQFQRMTEANESFEGNRSYIGKSIDH